MEIATRNRSSDYEVLQKLLIGEIEEEELTEHQMDKLRQVRSAHAMLLDLQSTAIITGKLMKVFGLSQASAWRVINMTEGLLGAQRRANKEYKRAIAEKMAIETYKMAKQRKDLKNMNAANANYVKINGLDREDPDLPDFSKLQPSLNVIVINPDIEKRVQELLSAGPLDLADLRKPKTIDIAHEELKADEGTENAG